MSWDGITLRIASRMSVRRFDDAHKLVLLDFVGIFAGIVRRLQTPHIWLRPYLEEVCVLLLVSVVLGVSDASACGGELNLASVNSSPFGVGANISLDEGERIEL